MRGHRFITEVNEAFKASLATVTKSGVHDGINGLVHRWKSLEVEGGYIEKRRYKINSWKRTWFSVICEGS